MKRKTASSSSAISFLSQSGDSLGLSSSLLWSGSLLKDFVDEYANLPGEINTALKKSMKKEPTTKLKGLAELSQLLETQPEDVILSFLEVWTRTYPKLSLDADKRVRQAVHSGPFLTLVRKAGRNLAPSLKKLIGQWISSQMDPISDVSEAAKSCFNEAIPASKHLQSLMFCKKEILQFIEDQIQQTPQILGETYRDLSKIQLQDLYERVVSSAISSLSLLINSFTEETNLELLPRYNEILGANFWKLDQKAPLIRKAKYLLVAALSNKCKVYIEQNLNQNVTNFIKFLDESDPNCFLALLDGLLCFFKQVPEAWRVAGAQKNFQSKIGARLRDAFHGNVASYSSLLPLMSVFPSTLIEDTKFFESFFQAMWAGLTSDNCLSSDALVSSFFEIIQYLTRQSNNSISANSAHQISPSAAPLIKDYLLGRALMFPLGQIFRFKFSDLDSASFFRSLSAFLVSLTNQTYASSAEDCNQCLERLSTFVEDVISRAEEVPSEAPAPAAEPVEGETESPTEKLINRLSLMITTIGSSVGEKEKDFTPFFQNIWKMLFEKAINSSETHFDLLSKIAKQMSFSPFLTEEQITRVLDDDFSSKLLRPPTNDAEFVRNWSRIACSCLSGAPQSVWDRFVSQVVSKLTRPVSLVFFQEVGQFSSSSGWASPEIDQYVLALLKQLQSDFSSKPKSARLCYRIIRLILSGIKIQNQTKELVAEKSSEFVDAFMAEDCSEQGFSIALIQQIVFLSYLLHTSLKSISSSSSSSSSSSGESGAPQDRLFSWIGSLFRLRNCTKYYWKGLALDETNQFVEATTDNQQQEKHDLLLSGDEVDEISSSPVAVVARSLWIDLQDTYFPLWSNQDLKGISDFLINTMDHILSVEVKLFSPEHAVEQLISATFLQTASKEFSPTDDQIEKIFGSEDLWVKARNQANLIQFLDSTRFADINFDSTLISSSSSSSSGQSGPPKFAFFRLLRLAVALLEKVNPAFLFHLDGRRDWMLAEMLLGAIVIQNASLHPFGEDPVQDELTLAREELFETTEEQEKTGIDLILDSMISSSSVPSGEDEDKQKNDQEGSGKRRAASVITILNERIRSGSFSRETEYLFAIELGFLLEKLSSGQSSASAELLLTHFSSFIIPGFPAPSEPVPVLLQEAVLPPLFSALQLSRDLQELQIPSLMQRVLAVATNLTDASQSDESKTLALRLISHLLQIEPLQNEEQGYLVYLLMTQLADCAKTPFVQEETLQIALCKIMKSCVRHPFGAAMFEPELWVFVTEQCGAWLQGSPRSAVFFQALKLLRSLEGLEPVRSSAETQLVQCNKHLFDQLFSLTLSSPPVPLGATDSAMLAELAKVVSLNFKTSRLGQYFASLPQALANLFQMVECPHSQVQLTAARVLILILQHLSETKQDVEAIPLLGKSTKSISKLPAVAVPLVSMITQGAGLSKSKSGRSAASKTLTIEEEPHLDYFFRHNLKSEFTFFLIWSIYLSWHRDQETKIKHTCCSLLKQDGVLFRYFDRLFGRLRELEVTEQPTGTFVDQLPFVDVKDEQSLRSFYNEIVLLTAFTLPGAFRSWSSETDKSLSQFVEGYMTTLIFPSVLRTEIEQINNYKSDNPNFWIKTRSNEIQANFKEDDTTITLKLKIPKTYPLQPVKLSSDNRKGIDENEWRKWTFSMTSLLMTSESNILDALMIWKNTVTKKFEDIEPCLICYSVFHISDNSLPKLACKTCRNKFHSGCLYRWFDTSHKSNCPLCQTPWMSD